MKIYTDIENENKNRELIDKKIRDYFLNMFEEEDYKYEVYHRYFLLNNILKINIERKKFPFDWIEVQFDLENESLKIKTCNTELKLKHFESRLNILNKIKKYKENTKDLIKFVNERLKSNEIMEELNKEKYKIEKEKEEKENSSIREKIEYFLKNITKEESQKSFENAIRKGGCELFTVSYFKNEIVFEKSKIRIYGDKKKKYLKNNKVIKKVNLINEFSKQKKINGEIINNIIFLRDNNIYDKFTFHYKDFYNENKSIINKIINISEF